MKITKATTEDFPLLVELGLLFWPHHPKEKVEQEFNRILASQKEASFISWEENNTTGFTNVSIRTDYVEGSNTNSTGYLEAIFIKQEYRNKGIAKQLFQEAENWLKEQGVLEIGSDAMLENTISRGLHKKLGFSEGEVLVHYLKKI